MSPSATKRASVAGRGGADEERARGRNVALGEGDETLGAQPARFVDRDRQRRAKAADGLLVDGLFAQRGRELADRGLVDRLSRHRRRRPLGDGDKGLDENRLLDRSLDVHGRRLKPRPGGQHQHAGDDGGEDARQGFPGNSQRSSPYCIRPRQRVRPS